MISQDFGLRFAIAANFSKAYKILTRSSSLPHLANLIRPSPRIGNASAANGWRGNVRGSARRRPIPEIWARWPRGLNDFVQTKEGGTIRPDLYLRGKEVMMKLEFFGKYQTLKSPVGLHAESRANPQGKCFCDGLKISRFRVFRSFADCNPSLSWQLVSKIAEIKEELEECFRLLYDA
jgi:hypothetical protein